MTDHEADTRGVEPEVIFCDHEPFRAAIDAEVAKRRKAEEELAGWIDNARTFSAKNGELTAEVARLRAALELMRDMHPTRWPFDLHAIAAAALDREEEA